MHSIYFDAPRSLWSLVFLTAGVTTLFAGDRGHQWNVLPIDDGEVKRMVFHANPRSLIVHATRPEEGGDILWTEGLYRVNLDTGKKSTIIEVRDTRIESFSVSKDISKVFAVIRPLGEKNFLVRIDARTALAYKIEVEGLRGVDSVALSPNGRALAVGGNNMDSLKEGAVVLLDAALLAPERTWHACGTRAITSMAFAPDASELAIGYWEVSFLSLDLPSRAPSAGPSYFPSQIEYHRTLPLLALHGSLESVWHRDRKCVVWEHAVSFPHPQELALRRKESRPPPAIGDLHLSSYSTKSAAFSAKRPFLAVLYDHDDVLRIWDVEAGCLKSSLCGLIQPQVVAVSDDDELFVATNNHEHKNVIWRLQPTLGGWQKRQ